MIQISGILLITTGKIGFHCANIILYSRHKHLSGVILKIKKMSFFLNYCLQKKKQKVENTHYDFKLKLELKKFPHTGNYAK